MFGRKYQWVIMGTYAEEWWLRPGGGCAPSELSEALHGTILTDLLPLATEQQITISGIVKKIFIYMHAVVYAFSFIYVYSMVLCACLCFHGTYSTFIIKI